MTARVPHIQGIKHTFTGYAPDNKSLINGYHRMNINRLVPDETNTGNINLLPRIFIVLVIENTRLYPRKRKF